jgi:hypothetical protein
MAFDRSSTSPLPIPTSPSSCNRLAVVQVVTIHSRTSISPFSQLIVRFSNMRISHWSPDLGLVPQRMLGRTSRVIGPSKVTACSPCLSMGFCSPAVMVAKEAHTSSSMKDLIVGPSGVDDAAWEGTYVKPTGGIHHCSLRARGAHP